MRDERLRRGDGYRVVNLTTFHNRSSELADLEIVFKPNTDLAIWNYIAREIVERDLVEADRARRRGARAGGGDGVAARGPQS